jgi:hypothetical protein
MTGHTRIRWFLFWVAGTAVLLLSAIALPEEEERDGTVEHQNRIVGIYLGKPRPNNATEIVIELADYRFAWEPGRQNCTLVNARPVTIDEYNPDDSYVRGYAWLGNAETVTAYSGIVKSSGATAGAPMAQWKVFEGSGCKPFVASRRELPRWWTTNPIHEKHRHDKPATSRPVTTRPTALQRVEMALAGNASPDLRPEDRPLVIEAALGGNFNAMRWLGISGYSPDAADALLRIATDKSFGETTRGCAAMGLGNYLSRLSTEQKECIRTTIAKVIQREGRNTPDTLIRLLIAMDGASLVAELMGNDLAGSRCEVEVLARLPGDAAGQRLWQLCEQLRDQPIAEVAFRIQVIGDAMLSRKDKRGADVLLSLLPKDVGLDKQFRHNTYAVLARYTRKDFGYKAVNYHPDLEAAVPKMIEWWKTSRVSFQCEDPAARRCK